MSYSPPTIADIGLPEYIESLRSINNGLGWSQFDLCMQSKLSNAAIGRLFNKHRKTIANWRKLYNTGGYNHGI